MDEIVCSGGCECQRGRVADDRGSVSRRGVLAGSVAAAAALALGACASTDEAGSTTSSSPSDSPSESASPDTPTDTASADASPSTQALAGTEDFPVGGGAVVMTAQGPVVVTHPTDTEYRAFNGRCPHAGCPVAEVLENTIQCNCHGSTFDASTGDRLEGPAPTGLEPVAIQVSDGEIYLA